MSISCLLVLKPLPLPWLIFYPHIKLPPSELEKALMVLVKLPGFTSFDFNSEKCPSSILNNLATSSSETFITEIIDTYLLVCLKLNTG